MKRKIMLLLFISATVIFASVSISYSEFLITQITNNSVVDQYPQINDNGHVVWERYDTETPPYGAFCGIFLYDGTVATQISNIFNYLQTKPQINNNGNIVWRRWDGSDSEIFLYNGTSTIQITDNSYSDQYPQINDNGYVVWQGRVSDSDGEIFFYDGTTTTQLTDNSYEYEDGPPQINNNGYVVWKGWDGDDNEIFLFNGTEITKLTENPYNDFDPQINNMGQVVWAGYDEIFFYDGTDITQITSNSYNDEYPQINNNGYIVWHGWDGSDYEIFLYDGTSTVQITDNSVDDLYPQINDNGYVVWQGWYDDGFKIFHYDGTIITLITNNLYSRANIEPKISNNGYITWTGIGRHETGVIDEIYLATPADNQTVVLIAPNGGEFLPPSSLYDIRWSATLGAVKFKIEYSIDNGSTWETIVNEVTGLSYRWLVPIVNSGKCFIKITGFDSSGVKICEDFSNSNFAIGVLKVTSPDGGEIMTPGDVHSITWQTDYTNKPVAKVRLKYTKNGGRTWDLITKLTGNPERYDWTVPSVTTPKTKCKVKVILKAADGTILATDKSDYFFTIQP